MAWGYWSASAVTDWTRSPRKGHKIKNNNKFKDLLLDQNNPQAVYKNFFRSVDHTDDLVYSTAPNNGSHLVSVTVANDSCNNYNNVTPITTTVSSTTAYDYDCRSVLSRQPSLEFNLTNLHGALSNISSDSRSSIRRNRSSGSGSGCSHRSHSSHRKNHENSQQKQHHSLHCKHHHHHHHHHLYGGSVSAGNTLTRSDCRRRTITAATAFETASDMDYSLAFPNQLIQFKPDRIDYYHERVFLDDDDTESAYATVFPNVPVKPGMPCQGEDKSIYRRGARRWRKLYRINGHIFQAKRFNRRAFCAFCQDRIWGLGRQGFKCNQCKLLVHKKCHKFIKIACTNDRIESVIQEEQKNNLVNSFVPPRDLVPITKDTADPQVANEELLAFEPGTQRQYLLDDFELIRVIGRGSYAKVLMVELKRTHRIYAMKVIKKALVTDDEDIDWVQSEKHVFETASNHPFLVGLHSCFQTSSRLFFVIEFVRGGDLMFHMQRQRRLPEEHARFYAAEISIALSFLHDRGIIYRDLKLDNVLLDHEGHIKLTDYGMCKEGIRPGDTTSTFCGTPNYIAPEILRGEEYGFSVDWWALGVLLYEMLAGRSPFDVERGAENSDQQTEDYLFQVILNKVIRIPRTLSVKASSVLKAFLNKNPAERLGCRGESTFRDIMDHPFFKSIDWELLERKQVTPPYTPKLDSDRDLANFPPEFTDELVRLTPDDPSELEKIDQSEFEGFEYVNPLLMSMEDCV